MFCDNHKNVNFEDKKSMISFLENHFRYNTMNSWNQSTSYANNVKLHNIGIPPEYEDKAYASVCGEAQNDEFDLMYNELKKEFTMKTGYDIAFNGRSSGYIVLYDTGYDKNNNFVTYIGRNIDMCADFDEWEMWELKERCELVMEFDKTCDLIRDAFIESLKQEIVEETVYVPKTVKYFTAKE